jgi:hypothetical protein
MNEIKAEAVDNSSQEAYSLYANVGTHSYGLIDRFHCI